MSDLLCQDGQLPYEDLGHPVGYYMVGGCPLEDENKALSFIGPSLSVFAFFSIVSISCVTSMAELYACASTMP
jgi:hypothetical protein